MCFCKELLTSILDSAIPEPNWKQITPAIQQILQDKEFFLNSAKIQQNSRKKRKKIRIDERSGTNIKLWIYFKSKLERKKGK